jgi:hypothetical protein
MRTAICHFPKYRKVQRRTSRWPSYGGWDTLTHLAFKFHRISIIRISHNTKQDVARMCLVSTIVAHTIGDGNLYVLILLKTNKTEKPKDPVHRMVNRANVLDDIISSFVVYSVLGTTENGVRISTREYLV